MKLILNNSLAFINGLRRSLISYVPSFSLNTKFIENETDYNTDILNLRISMIPVKTQFKCSLQKTNNTDKIIKITSNDFNNENIMQDIFIFNLKPKQTIHIECESEMGYGYQHSRWQVIQTPWMKKIEDVVFKKYDAEKFISIVPELFINGKLDKQKCLIDRTAVAKLNEISPIVTFTHNGDYELGFESNYYDEKFCLDKAFEHLKQLFNSFEYEIIHDPNIKILKFNNRSYTFGNILQYYLQQKCNFSSFIKPHHLDNYILIKMDNNLSILEDIRKQILLDLEQFQQSCIL